MIKKPHYKAVFAFVLFLAFFVSTNISLAQTVSTTTATNTVGNGVAPLSDVLELMLRLNMIGSTQSEKARALGVLLEKVNVNGVFMISGQAVTKALASSTNNTSFNSSGMYDGISNGDFVLDYKSSGKTSFSEFLDLLSALGLIKADKIRQAKALAILTGNPLFQGKILIVSRSTPSNSTSDVTSNNYSNVGNSNTGSNNTNYSSTYYNTNTGYQGINKTRSVYCNSSSAILRNLGAASCNNNTVNFSGGVNFTQTK